jgi:hypothetical protein
VHQADAGEIAVGFGKQAVDQRAEAGREVGEHGKAKLQRDQAAEPREAAAGYPFPERPGRMRRAGLGHDRIDDQLADIKHQDRQHCPQQAQPEARERQRRARLPDELDETGEMAQRANALAEGLRGLERGEHQPKDARARPSLQHPAGRGVAG